MDVKTKNENIEEIEDINLNVKKNKKKRKQINSLKEAILALIMIILIMANCFYMGIQYYQFKILRNASDKFDTDKLFAIKQLLEEEYLFQDRLNEKKLLEGAIEGMVYSADDIYTRYISGEVFEEFRTETTGKYTGIGISVSKDETGALKINEVFKGQSAEEAGLKPNDKIVKINGQSIKEMNVKEATALIKGEINTDVVLTVLRDGKLIDIKVRRKNITLPVIKHQVLDKNIGYIYIGLFNAQTEKEFEKAYNELMKNNIKGLIIDLRDNKGGLLNEAVKIADKFLDKNKTIVTVIKKNTKEIIKTKQEKEINLPLVVLVNEKTASAAEIFSVAIKDNNRGVLVGKKTFGKGLIQNTYKIGDKSMLIITTGKYLTPNGEDIHAKGIIPNYEIEYSMVDMIKGIDSQLEKAKEILKKIKNET